MNCSLATLAACFSLAGVHFDAGLAVLDQAGSPTARGYDYWRFDITETHNPYGVLSAGYDIRFRKLSFDLSARHQSSVPVNDRGQNSLQITMTWRPWL